MDLIHNASTENNEKFELDYMALSSDRPMQNVKIKLSLCLTKHHAMKA
jgi:hypothetical protein